MPALSTPTGPQPHAGRHPSRRGAGPCSALPLALLIAGPALLPPATARAQEPAEAVVTLPPITVTARRREENAQEVPIGMTVLQGDRLTASPIASNADLARLAPNLSFVDLGGQSPNFANIRGVGSFSPVSGDDTSVVFYVDEVPLSVYGVAPSLLDIERVEVLRGPQGTLFGRNTQGGAISIIPRRPSFDREFSTTGEIGTDGYALGHATANGAIIPGLVAGRLALGWSRFGGDISNIAAGGRDGALDIGAARGALLFTPGDRTEALLSFTYGRDDSHSPRFLLRDAADFPVSATVPRTHVAAETYGVSLRIRHELDAFALTSLTSIQRNRSTQDIDLTDGLVFARVTGLPARLFNTPGADFAHLRMGETTYLQEFRLSSLPESRTAWTLGAHAFRSESFADRDARAVTPAFASANGIQANDFTTSSYALFGEVTLPVTDRLRVTLGLRATHEDKSASYRFDGNGLPGVARFFAGDLGLRADFLTGRAAVSYDWTPGFMTYASIARGYVSAGFPAIAVNSAIGRPEEAFPASRSWTYEIGFKSTLLGGRLTLNGALFHNDVKDGHLAVFNPALAMFTTAALDYRSLGGEIEVAARLAPGFDLFGGIGYTRAELRDIPARSLTGARTGNDVPNVPAVTANIGIQHRWSAAPLRLPGEVIGRLTYQYVASRAADVANSFDLRAYGIVNARIGWENDGVNIYAFANNIFDERYQSWGQSFGTTPTVRVGLGRVVGVGTAFQF